jgi:hypothetical protein
MARKLENDRRDKTRRGVPSDASGQLFSEILQVADAAAPSLAGGMRVRRRCENGDNDWLADIALRSQFSWRDNGDGQPVDGKYSHRKLVSVYGNGDR